MKLRRRKRFRGALPSHATYIGRAMPDLARSQLANPYIAQSRAPARCTHAVVVPDESVLERYRRSLTAAVIKGFPERRALNALRGDAVLVCWCVDRDAARVGAGRPEPEAPCHGDVVFTVWLALEALAWRVPAISFTEDFSGANKAWAELYERAFGEPMLWGREREAGTCSLPPAVERGAA